MKTEKKDLVTLVVLGLFLLGFSLWALFKPADAASESERRALAQLPQFTAQSVLSGGFAQQFEDYATDQFPLREPFRRLKALTATRILRQRDNNGLYLREGYLSKLEYPMDLSSLDHVEERFSYLCQRYLREAGCSVYLCAIPDKNYFLAAAGGYPSLDYEAFVQELRRRTDDMQYIDVFDLLELEDYYRTDTHWRQETLLPVAEKLASAMGVTLSAEYETQTLSEPFYGVYAGQSALPLPPDTLSYLTNDILEGCTVTSYDTGTPQPAEMYDLSAAASADPYELFLNGADALLMIENPAAATDRELVVFRDSFGSSLVPLLVEGYSKVTLVDIRYLNSAYLGNFVEFDDQDVLFLYSTLLLNDSLALK